MCKEIYRRNLKEMSRMRSQLMFGQNREALHHIVQEKLLSYFCDLSSMEQTFLGNRGYFIESHKCG